MVALGWNSKLFSGYYSKYHWLNLFTQSGFFLLTWNLPQNQDSCGFFLNYVFVFNILEDEGKLNFIYNYQVQLKNRDYK